MTDGAENRLRSRGVFISYRRGETSGQARALHDRLSQRFGTERVFMDVDSIAPGADFVQKIEEAIDSSGVALVLIGRDWLSREPNQHLLDDPSDFVRLETDAALRSGVPVIPILVERARMPTPEELPESLRPLTRRNALELENQRWEYDVGRLVSAVEQLVDPPQATSSPDPDAVRTGPEVIDKTPKDGARRSRSRRFVVAGLGVLVVVIAVVVCCFVRGPSRPPHRSQLAMPLRRSPQIGLRGCCSKVGSAPPKYPATSRLPNRNWFRSGHTGLWMLSMSPSLARVRSFRSTTSSSTTPATPARITPTAARFRTTTPSPGTSSRGE